MNVVLIIKRGCGSVKISVADIAHADAALCYTITNITNIQSATRDWPDDSPATCSGSE